MKILIFNQYYKPLNNPPAKRLSAFAEYFVKKGWNVNVITGHPNYPQGKLYKGYNGIYKKEIISNVKVYRYLEIPLEIKGAIKPLLNYFSFAFSSIFSLPKIFNSKIILLSSPPIFSLYLPFLISILLKKKVVLDIRDLWPDSLVGLGYLNNNSIMYKLLNNLNKFIFNKSDLIITISEELNQELSKKTKTKVHKITNFAKKDYRNFEYNKIRILYLGRLTEVYNILDYVDAISELDNIELHIVGDGDLKDKIIKCVDNKNIYFYGYLENGNFSKIIDKCNVGLIPLKDIKLNEEAFPSKTFDYLSYGMPILFNTSKELIELNNKYEFGWNVCNPNKQSIKDLIRKIALDDIPLKSENAKKLFNEKFEESIVCEKMYKLIEEL